VALLAAPSIRSALLHETARENETAIFTPTDYPPEDNNAESAPHMQSTPNGQVVMLCKKDNQG
jgi:hypothetical protein